MSEIVENLFIPWKYIETNSIYFQDFFESIFNMDHMKFQIFMDFSGISKLKLSLT